MMKALRHALSFNLEAIVWIGALLFLAFSDPNANQHYNLCIFKIFGFDHCPGCGLGHSISYLLHGDFNRSLEAHPMGLPALFILTGRIATLIIKSFRRTLPAKSR